MADIKFDDYNNRGLGNIINLGYSKKGELLDVIEKLKSCGFIVATYDNGKKMMHDPKIPSGNFIATLVKIKK